MDFVEPLSEEEATYWKLVAAELSADERESIKHLPPEAPKLFVVGVMNKYPKAKGQKLVNHIVKRMQSHISWYEENEVAKCLTKKYEKARTYRDLVWPVRFVGVDPSGYGIFIAKLSDCDWAAAHKVLTTKEELIQYFLLNMELTKIFLKADGMPYKSHIIFDFQGMTMSNFYQAHKLGIKSLFSTLAEHNPESTVSISAINAPAVFGFMFRALKPLMPHDTIAKVTITSGEEAARKHFKDKGFVKLVDYPQGLENCQLIISDALCDFYEGPEEFEANVFEHVSDLLLEA